MNFLDYPIETQIDLYRNYSIIPSKWQLFKLPFNNIFLDVKLDLARKNTGPNGPRSAK
jgi:hypothetical protein